MTWEGGLLPRVRGAASSGASEGDGERAAFLRCAQGVGVTTGSVDFFFVFFEVEVGILKS
jgi:hypothetical protein